LKQLHHNLLKKIGRLDRQHDKTLRSILKIEEKFDGKEYKKYGRLLIMMNYIEMRKNLP